MPNALCEFNPGSINRNLIVNRDKPPFDDPNLRQAMALSVDRKAFVDIISEGQGEIGGGMQPPSRGILGVPPRLFKGTPGHYPAVAANPTHAPPIMGKP